jgi:hypothetical protein
MTDQASIFFDAIREIADPTMLTITALDSVIREGMRVSYNGDTNRIRRRVGTKVSGTTYLIQRFVRPSRGFARHLRKMKRKN